MDKSYANTTEIRKLAIISCKAKKKTYACNASEMYSDSPQFKHQILFINEYYDDYKILSLKYGILDKDDHIEPYNLTLTPGSSHMSKNPTITHKSKINWATKVRKQIANLSFQYDRIDLHLSSNYLTEINDVLEIPNVISVTLPSLFELKSNYTKATDLYKEQGDVKLEVINKYIKWKRQYSNELLNKKIILPWKS